MRRPAAAATMPAMGPQLQLFQAEWCPSSHRVRQRLTELGVDYVARQVPVERCARTALVAATGCDTIPALLLPNGAAVVGESNIVAYLGEHFEAGASARRHRTKAAELHRRRLEEECRCSPLATR